MDQLSTLKPAVRNSKPSQEPTAGGEYSPEANQARSPAKPAGKFVRTGIDQGRRSSNRL